MYSLMFAIAVGLSPTAPPGRVAVERDDEAVHFYVEGELVASFHYGPNIDKPYLDPILAPGRIAVTRTFPFVGPAASSDRPYQASAWIGLGSVVPEGVSQVNAGSNPHGIDFWTDQPGHGFISCSSVTVVQGAGRAEARCAITWKSASGKAVIDEERQIELYNLEYGRLLIVTSTLRSAGMPIHIGTDAPGFMAVRVNDQLRVANGLQPSRNKSKIINANGDIGEVACSTHLANWCDYSGIVDGYSVGVTLFDDPANKPRARWRARNYGLLSANPFARLESETLRDASTIVQLRPGEQLTFRFGIFAHRGDAETGDVAGSYRKFLSLLP